MGTLVPLIPSWLIEQHKHIFEKYPQVEGIRWSQGTYFNDGDATYFSSNFDEAVPIDEDGGELDYESNQEVYDAIADASPKLDYDVLENLWEDNTITIRVDSIEVGRNYNH